MGPIARRYEHESDYSRVGEFLVRTYRTSGSHVNWLQPRWEYMHHHPLIRKLDLGPIGISTPPISVTLGIAPSPSDSMDYPPPARVACSRRAASSTWISAIRSRFNR